MYFSLLIAAGILIGIYSGMLAPLAALFVDSVKFEFYFTQKARFGFLQYWVIFALFMLLLWAISARRRLDKRGFIVRSSDFESDSSFNARQEKFIDFFMRSRFVLLPYYALLPLSVQNFYRLIRSFLIVMYIFLSIAVLERPIIQNHKENLLEKALFFVWVAANAIVVEAGVWDLVIVTELTENLLW